jgi:hypothetical protein
VPPINRLLRPVSTASQDHSGARWYQFLDVRIREHGLAGEAIIPLNRAGGNSLGFRTQLLFFLDDLIPQVFGKPLLTSQPARSQIVW